MRALLTGATTLALILTGGSARADNHPPVHEVVQNTLCHAQRVGHLTLWECVTTSSSCPAAAHRHYGVTRSFRLVRCTRHASGRCTRHASGRWTWTRLA